METKKHGDERALIRWLVVMGGLTALAGCTEEDHVSLYRASPKAPSYSADDIEALEHLGATIVDDGVNFAVYSENAEKMRLLLFEDPEASRATRELDLTRFGNVWNVYVEGVGAGQHYGYIAWGPNWPFDPQWYPGSIHGFIADVDARGNRFNPNKLLIDPYARAIHRDHDWSKGSTASGPARSDSTIGAASKSVVAESKHVWSEGALEFRRRRMQGDLEGHGWNELVMYEVHLKGFTKDSASGVDNRGTYRGFGEMADYLADLGVNAVELMPVHEKPLDGGYWGYQTLNFFTPELSYAATHEPRRIIDEFKWMVDELHQRGIEVILDVVYNHTGEGGLWREKILQDDFTPDPGTSAQLVNFDPKEVAGLYSFRGLDNAAYYALSEDGQTYWNNTGVGNQTRTNHQPFRRLILDSLRYWVEELHVDGFRFDLAPVLAARDLDYNRKEELAATVLQEIIDDPVLRAHNARIIAEPWAPGGDYGWMLGGFPAASDGSSVGWYEWNAHFRDWWRSFVNQDDWRLNSSLGGPVDGGFVMTGSHDTFAWNGRKPYHSVNFVTVHDGFTLYDLFSYDHKRNDCGPLNPVCCTDPMSPFCDPDSGENHNRSRDWGSSNEPLKRQLIRNMFVGLLLSHGTPLIYGGDEWMRTQLGNNNAYSTGADGPANWFEWGVWRPSQERVRMHDFVRKLVRYRKLRKAAFAPAEWGSGAPFAWKNASNQDMQGADWGGRHFAWHFYDGTAGAEILVLVNMEVGQVDFTLPGGRSWARVLDTQSYFDTAEFFTGGAHRAPTESANIDPSAAEQVSSPTYGVPSRSIVVLEAQP